MIPPLMGGVADHSRVIESFFILGALMLLLFVPLALLTRRARALGLAVEGGTHSR